MSSTSHPCDVLLSEVASAFERIARGLPPDCKASVAEALIEAGLVRRSVRVVGRDSLGVVVQRGYRLTRDAETQWNEQIDGG